ncbi:unnamed protein product [Oppiella nova]|uniref:RBR-type E3 ubiquitin transferase n=1 Tax=Oppiella nova TaxID=334625 RepID=A0A7R9M960_9ACAR|nr:unnamed protein product [Oppiella nova]CAG2173118.1 unnamed protein product [Oppiella nova]
MEKDRTRDKGIQVIKEFYCSICTDTYPIDRWVSCGCDHRFCADCMTGHLTTKINESQLEGVACPGYRCSRPAPHHLVKKLDPDNTIYEGYVTLSLKTWIRDAPDVHNVGSTKLN